MPHLTIDVYQMILEGSLPPRTLVRALHEHLLESCPECAQEWRSAAALGLRDGRAGERKERVETDAAARAVPPGREPGGATPRLRTTAGQARQDLRRLLRRRPEDREELIINATTRYRSRAFLELLIEHCRERVREAPRDAAELLELVPTILLWTPGGLEARWSQALHVRSEAHRGNALRVAGDLPGAERVFAEVRRRLARVPLADAPVYAEVASLEASLRWDQARHEEAMALLDQAVLIDQEAGEREGLARALIQRASIAHELERRDQALDDLARARELLDPAKQSFLYLFTVVGAAPILLDVERYEEADRVLTRAMHGFAAASEPWWALRLRHLQGRAALGLGDPARAERLLLAARQGCLDKELPYDAAAVSLELAVVYLHQGRTADARRMAREIAPIFQGCGVEREALAALALFRNAGAVDAAALAQVAQLRRHLAAAQPPTARRPAAGG